MKTTVSFFVLLFLLLQNSFGQNLRQISSREGISNNAILSLCQDRDGYIWLGTCDGLNLWDGNEMQLFPPSPQIANYLSGNLIEEIVITDDNLFWIRTNHGLDKLNPTSKSVERHSELQGSFMFATRKSDEVFVFFNSDGLQYYNKQKKYFEKAVLKGVELINVLDIVLAKEDELWFFCKSGIYYSTFSYSADGSCSFGALHEIKHPYPLLCAYEDHGTVYFIDDSKVFYELDLTEKQITYKKKLKDEIDQRGKVSGIIRDGKDYMVAFFTNGVIRLKATPQNSEKYVSESLDIFCGVFSLMKDHSQDIVWIGSDGQGLYQYTKSNIIFKTVSYTDLPVMVSKPARAMYMDRENTLWVGTKDDGILRISDFYNCKKFTSQNTQKITKENSALTSNAVFVILPSSRNILWIGSDGPGLNYYSYKDKSFHKLPSTSGIISVHGLLEVGDSVLWIATTGRGIYKASISGTKDAPVLSSIQPVYFNEILSVKDIYFTIFKENDSILWFGNRGEGAVRYNTVTNKHRVLKFASNLPMSANDIFSVYRSKDKRMWFGTGSGLIGCANDAPSAEALSDPRALLTTHNAIHGVLEDSKGNLWLSSNRGLTEFSPNDSNYVTYGYAYGLNTIEFSDGAFFLDEKKNVMFFGGINGFVTVSENSVREYAYDPAILFKDIRINEKIESVSNLLKDDELVLDYDQNFFTLTISALDYVNGSNYSYMYKLEGYNEEWINNFHSNKLSFTGLPPGRYLLHVRYHNYVSDTDSQVYDLRIHILPPWYASPWAKLVYALVALIVIGSIIQSLILRHKKRKFRRQQKLEQVQKEEVYESKLRFFSYITRELSTPLTLIGGPCQQILGYNKADNYVKDYAATIQRNVSKLNELMFMLNEFSGAGNNAVNGKIELLSVTLISREITQSYMDYSRNSLINYNVEIQNDMIWPSDRDDLSLIMNTLLSYAFKHTPVRGEVGIVVRVKEEALFLSVSNSGTELRSDELEQLFDRYRALDSFEKQGEKNTSYVGLELAICHNTVTKMQGVITVESSPNNMITFVVKLPRLEVSNENNATDYIIAQDKIFNLPVIERKEYAYDKDRFTMFVIHENPEILNFVADLFATRYNLHVFHDAQEADVVLKQVHPNIIICTIIPESASSGIDFVKQIKQDKQTTHIPVILLSSTQQKDIQLKGIESGADICLTLPFDVEYLKAVTAQLLKKNQSLKDYYKSSLSSFELLDGQMLHKDDKEFLDKMLQIISDNSSDTELSTSFVADSMGISVRNLYRRLNGITNQTPINIIKQYRLHIAEQLLVTTKMSIDEIIYKSGFNNRGTFFKCFAEKYGCTPKIYRERMMDGLN
ncbi:MAG: two-component regulator propeller domain-containing protein [Bacteroidales bacterium]|nr:two-component regulator propeller domain-containing protein [Bacteroidales bacterium]